MTASKGYFDRTPKIRNHGEMEALLEKRAPGALAKSAPAAAVPARSAPSNEGSGLATVGAALDWLPRVEGMEAIVTACGRYSVARARVGGVASYQAWARLPTPQRLEGGQITADAAKQIAQSHFAGAAT